MPVDTKKLIGNTDATVWADAWCEIATEIAESDDDRQLIDWGWMIGWFANAIMAGFDEGHKRALKEVSDVTPYLLGDPTEHEVVPSQASSPSGIPVTEIAPINPTEHMYPDEVVARMAQEIEDLYDVLGDLLTSSPTCDYNTQEWCVEHRIGRPCPFELARSVLDAK